jgi:RND family efflux transporter MFP subunit
MQQNIGVKMSKALKIIALIVIIAGLAFGGYKLFIEKQENKEETEIIKADGDAKNDTAKKKEAALPVKALKIKRGNLPLRLNISATADVWEKATLKPEISGTVEDITVKVGDWVKKEQLLIRLDDVEKKLELKQREAEKLKAQTEYLINESVEILSKKTTPEQREELNKLKASFLKASQDLKKGKITAEEFEKVGDEYQKAMIFSGDLREKVSKTMAGLSGAIVALKRAELDLKRTRILSPFQGIVASLGVSKGEKVSAGVEALKIVNLKTLYLKGFALESEIANLKVGTRVRIKFDSFPNEFYYGEIESISPEIDPERKTISVYVKVDNKDKKFLPGMHAEIDVEYKVFENVIKVPRNAVVYRQDRYLVFVVRDLKGSIGIANWEYVTIGNQNDEEIEILSGVNEGDLVLIEGHQTLAHQSRVKIVK